MGCFLETNECTGLKVFETGNAAERPQGLVKSSEAQTTESDSLGMAAKYLDPTSFLGALNIQPGLEIQA